VSQELKYLFRGQMLTQAEIERAQAPKKTKPKAEPPEAYHRGFRVVGHAPGSMERAREVRFAEINRWNQASAEQQAKRLLDGEKIPKPWDESVWLKTTGKRTIKTLQLSDAADLAADIARKSGWLEVDIVPLTKGERPEGWA
jgi:hypothetical protein